MQIDLYEKAIEDFKIKGKNISNIRDLLLRGTNKFKGNVLPGWSDIDFSIVVEKLTPINRQEIRQLTKELQKKYPFKISFTVVTESDFASRFHHHGTKPLYYGTRAKQAPSLLHIDSEKNISICDFNSQLIKVDCYYHLSYLIHDLRKQYFSVGEKLRDLQNFALHLARRIKHLIKDSIVCLSGSVIEVVTSKELSIYLPEFNLEFLLETIHNIKKNWLVISNNKSTLRGMVEYMLDQADQIYEAVIKKVRI